MTPCLSALLGLMQKLNPQTSLPKALFNNSKQNQESGISGGCSFGNCWKDDDAF